MVWLKEDDRNTTFFQRISNGRSRNRDDEWLTNAKHKHKNTMYHKSSFINIMRLLNYNTLLLCLTELPLYPHNSFCLSHLGAPDLANTC